MGRPGCMPGCACRTASGSGASAPGGSCVTRSSPGRSSAGAARRRSVCRACGPPRTWSSAISRRPSPTACGARTSRTSGLGGLAVPGVGDDCYSRRIVGWAIADHLRAELVVDALEMAVARRRPDAGLVHHGDQGSQYPSLVFTRRCRAARIDVLIGSRGDCFDNAVLESFHANLKNDLIHRQSWPTNAAARTAVFDYLEAFYNRRRCHLTLGMLSPLEFENGTLRPAGASLAASRLASIKKMNYQSTSAAKPPKQPRVHRSGGGPALGHPDDPARSRSCTSDGGPGVHTPPSSCGRAWTIDRDEHHLHRQSGANS
jgi:transposase InsO family protein